MFDRFYAKKHILADLTSVDGDKLIQIDDFVCLKPQQPRTVIRPLISRIISINDAGSERRADQTSRDSEDVGVASSSHHSPATVDDFRVSTMTVLAFTGASIDLYTAYANVQVWPMSRIVNARYGDYPIRGMFRRKHANSMNSEHQMLFNQVTFDVANSHSRVISCKIFRDGTLQMAGFRQTSEISEVITELCNHLNRLENVIVKTFFESRCTEDQARDLDEYRSRASLTEWASHLTDLAKLPRSRMRLSPLKFNAMPRSTESGVQSRRVDKKVVEVATKLCHPPDLSTHHRSDKAPMTDTRTKIYRYDCEIPAISKKIRNDSVRHRIVMINSDFDTHRKIDKLKMLTHLTHFENVHCRPESSRYPGINAKFISSVDCLVHRAKKDEIYAFKDLRACASGKKNRQGKQQWTVPSDDHNGNCAGCQTITMLIFGGGKIIMTGATSIRQLRDAHTFIKSILDEHFT